MFDAIVSCREREAAVPKSVKEAQPLKGPDSVKHAMVSLAACYCSHHAWRPISV